MRTLRYVVLLLAALTMGAAPPAAAHTILLSSDPAAGAVLQSGPQRVSATFNEAVQPAFAAMTIVGPDGNLWSGGDPEVRGVNVSIGMRPSGPAGVYTVNYRVTSSDGHVVTGSWSFTVASTGTGSPGPVPSGAPGTKPGSPSRIPSRIPLWPFAIGAVILVGGAAAWALRRRS